MLIHTSSRCHQFQLGRFLQAQVDAVQRFQSHMGRFEFPKTDPWEEPIFTIVTIWVFFPKIGGKHPKWMVCNGKPY